MYWRQNGTTLFGLNCDINLSIEKALKTTKQPGSGVDYSDPAKAIATLRGLVDQYLKLDQKDPEVQEETIKVPARDGYELELVVFKPNKSLSGAESTSSTSPLIVLYFGGGFIYGKPQTMAPLARPLVKLFNAIVVAPEYRLAPEHPFPTSVDDGWDCFRWIAKNAATLGANPSTGFIIGGISSGANICNPVAHLARDDGVHRPITGVWLCCSGARVAPELADKLPEKYRARLLSRTQPECTKEWASPGHEKVKECLKPDLNSELYSPLIWPTEAGHKNFPRT